ncbi:hypothetical protein KW786_01755 [Candidatus Parcubacteria bacterium]|nr:hypothetical protein [Candidatus Parcubacteria bacterium]
MRTPKTLHKFFKLLLGKNKRFLFFVVSILLLEIALVAFNGGGFDWTRGFLHTTTTTAPPGILLFEASDCANCTKVETFIKNNAVESKVKFTRLDVVNNSTNMNILSDKAQTCGLDQSQLGVPFLWDGSHCILGYVDVIQFFRKEMAKPAVKPKNP